MSPSIENAQPVVGGNFADLVAGKARLAGYFGTPAIATAAAGEHAMNAIAQATVDAVELRVAL